MRSARRASEGISLLFATLSALAASSCGPRTVTARLVTRVAEAPEPVSTATPVPPAPAPAAITAAPRPTASPTATAVPPSPTATPTRTPVPSPTLLPVSPSPSLQVPPHPVPSPSPIRTLPPTPSPTSTSAPSPADAVVSPTAAPTEARPSITGDWDFRADTGTGVIAGTLRFAAGGSGLEGTYIGLRGNATQLLNLRLASGRISFDLVSPRAVWHLEGTVSGDRIDGTFQTAERLVPWTALRRR